jgi:D-3-phosphoglycerate dehydrogenase
MRIVAFDPFVSVERARLMGAELLPLDQAVAEADFLTVHLPRNAETIGLINRELLLKAKPSLRIVNVARGGIVVESDLAECISEGLIAGAALDVFDTEPCTDSPLFSLPEVVVTPHLGASTREAQDKAGDAIADMVQLALAGDFVPWAVNVDAAEADEMLRPFLGLAERLGRLFSSLSIDDLSSVELRVEGDIAACDTRILVLAVLKGMLAASVDELVTFVNAPQLASEAGIDLSESKSSVAEDHVNLIAVRGGGRSIAGTLLDRTGAERLVEIDGHGVDMPPAANMLLISNDDRPGVIGTVGTLLGDAGINIADMDVGRVARSGGALMLIAATAVVSDDVLSALRSAPGVTSVVSLRG